MMENSSIRNRQSRIRVLVVDDSSFLRRNIPALLETDSEIKVVGTAADGREAINMTRKLRPDVITLDVIMPVMDGLTALRYIMREVPTPVVMVSSVTCEGTRQTMKALSLGAVDYISKPSGTTSLDIGKIRNKLIQKIKTAFACKVKVTAPVDVNAEKFRIIISKLSAGSTSFPQPARELSHGEKELIAIAASTGGPAALQIVLESFPSDLSAGLVIVQHIAKGFSQAMAERLNSISPLEIKVSRGNEMVRPGLGLIAPAENHLTVKKIHEKFYTVLDKEPANVLYRPSADVLFGSVAQACGKKACAVIMTGMGKDGAKGIKQIRDRGGTTIAQDEATSIIYGMPKAAIENGGIDIIAPLENISAEIMNAVNKK